MSDTVQEHNSTYTSSEDGRCSAIVQLLHQHTDLMGVSGALLAKTLELARLGEPADTETAGAVHITTNAAINRTLHSMSTREQCRLVDAMIDDA